MKKIIILLLATLLLSSPAVAYPYNEPHTMQLQLETARIKTVKVQSAYNSQFEGYRPYGTGTGTLLGNGMLLTNAHVLGNNTGTLELSITTYNGEHYRGELLKIDRVVDLALIRIDSQADGFIFSNINLYKGMSIMTVGQPMGLPQWSYSEGTIQVVAQPAMTTTGQLYTAIMTDAQVIQGNSGGPLINDRGELVGIVRAATIDRSFAIPMSDIKIFLTHALTL